MEGAAVSERAKWSTEGQDTYPLDRLLFRRQFVLGPRFVERLKAWETLKIRDSLFLTVHPDLQVLQTVHDDRTLTLLGYILDPYNPKANDTDVIDRLLRQSETSKDIFQHTNSLGGRWILIFDDGEDVVLFNDATGLRQAFYTGNSLQNLWCASQPGIIAEELNLQVDEEVLNKFINSPEYRSNIEYWWPGDSSPFREVKHLSPNHYLDLKKGTCHRYWPNEKLGRISLYEGARKGSDILQGLIRSAFNRFDLAFTLTAGYDTRVLLAASREVSDNVWYYTLLCRDLTEESPDIRIPSKLLGRLGLKHRIIKCPSKMDREFEGVFNRNVATAHYDWGIQVQGLYNHYPQNKVSVKGAIGSEIPRSSSEHVRFRPLASESIKAEKLAEFRSMGKNTFMIRHFDSWLSEAREIAKRYELDILILFNWEQYTGNWQAMSQLEWDIAQEVFTPYNCRELLTTLLAVEVKHRRPPDWRLYRELIMNMWPDTLTEPINPPPIGLRTSVLKLLIKAHLYQFVRYGILKLVFNSTRRMRGAMKKLNAY